ncbi:unnamed protein product [Calypogeia fissa]
MAVHACEEGNGSNGLEDDSITEACAWRWGAEMDANSSDLSHAFQGIFQSSSLICKYCVTLFGQVDHRP